MKTEHQKICIIAALMARKKEFGRLEGTARVAHELANHLSRVGYDVSAITDFSPSKSTILDRNYELYNLHGEFSLGNMAELRNYVQEIDPAIVHFHGGEDMSYCAALCKLLTGKPTIFTFTWIPSLVRYLGKIWKREFRTVLLRLRSTLRLDFLLFDHVIALTEFSKLRLINGEDFQRNKISVIPYGVEDDFLNYNTDFQKDRNTEKVVLFWGDGSFSRGFHLFLSSMEAVLDKVPNATFIAAVRKMSTPALSRIANSKASKEKRFKLLDLSRNPYPENIINIIASSSIVVLPYVKPVAIDPPMTLLESMALGKCVLTSPIGSIAEIVGMDRGVIVNPLNSQMIERELIRLLVDDIGREGTSKNAKAYMEIRYNWKKVVDSISHLYQRVLHRCAPMVEKSSLHACKKGKEGFSL